VPLQETTKKGRAAFETQAKKARPYRGDGVIVGMEVDLAQVGRIRAAIELDGEAFWG
jgi:hypothetical protein